MATIPTETLQEAIGSKVWILLKVSLHLWLFPLQLLLDDVKLTFKKKNDRELQGTLIGVDDFVNMVMEDVTELSVDRQTGVSKEIGKVDQLLLNGNNVVMILPQGKQETQ